MPRRATLGGSAVVSSTTTKPRRCVAVPRRTTSAGKDFYDTPATKQAAFTADWEMASARMSLGKKIQRGSDKLDEPDPTPLETFRDVMAKSVWLV